MISQPPAASPRGTRAASFRRLADASSVGLAFPLAMGIGFVWGRSLDRFLGTWPWCAVVFSVFGVAAGFLNAFRVGLRVGEEADREARRRGARGDR